MRLFLLVFFVCSSMHNLKELVTSVMFSMRNEEVKAMKFVEKHSKILAVALCICASGPILSTVYAYETQPGWHGQDNDRYYVLESNRQRATGLTEIDDEVYYFNGQGEMQFGWQTISNTTYYFGSDGKAASGETAIQGTSYNFQETGSLKQGWSEDGQNFFDEKGFKTSSAWVDVDGARYWFDENGSRVTGWREIDGTRYFFGEDGRMVTGQFEADGQTFYASEDGSIRSGWFDRDGVKAYYNEDGSKVVNAVQEIDGTTYGFDENGNVLVNTEKDGYVFDETGAGTVIAPEEVPATPEQTPADMPVEAPSVPAETPSAPVEVPTAPEETPVKPEVMPSAPEQTPVQPEETPVVPEQTPSAPETPAVPEEIPSAPVETPSEPVQPEIPSVPETDTNKASAILAAAMGQLGVNQDCTMLVTNALRAVGINFHGWPSDYAALGSWTSAPVPGDIIIYSGHVAIYAGNGQAVHGGWNGYQTVLASVNCSTSLIGYIHVA